MNIEIDSAFHYHHLKWGINHESTRLTRIMIMIIINEGINCHSMKSVEPLKIYLSLLWDVAGLRHSVKR